MSGLGATTGSILQKATSLIVQLVERIVKRRRIANEIMVECRALYHLQGSLLPREMNDHVRRVRSLATEYSRLTGQAFSKEVLVSELESAVRSFHSEFGIGNQEFDWHEEGLGIEYVRGLDKLRSEIDVVLGDEIAN